jgi:hypothetical protein
MRAQLQCGDITPIWDRLWIFSLSTEKNRFCGDDALVVFSTKYLLFSGALFSKTMFCFFAVASCVVLLLSGSSQLHGASGQSLPSGDLSGHCSTLLCDTMKVVTTCPVRDDSVMCFAD